MKPLRVAKLCLLVGALLLSLHLAAQAPSTPSFNMRLIVVGSREEAEDILQQLSRGRDFAALAKEKSIDPTAAEAALLDDWIRPACGRSCATRW